MKHRLSILDSFPHTILLHGTVDRTVPHQSTVLFAEALARTQATCEVVLPQVQSFDFDNEDEVV